MLHSIHQKKFNIGLMNVEDLEPFDQKEYLASQWEKIPTQFKCIIEKQNFDDQLEQIENLYFILDESPDKLKLINFVKTLIANYADVTDAPILGISVEKVTSDMCKYFHCDVNHLRLVYPLLGPGTLWAGDDNVRRENLGKGRNEDVIINQDRIFQVPAKTITILKGNGHPTGSGSAIVHASPIVSATKEKRILLRIESIF